MKSKMNKFRRNTLASRTLIVFVILNQLISINNGLQNEVLNQGFRRERVSWCTTSQLERRKCLDWARAIEDTNSQLSHTVEPFELNLDCIEAANKDQCMALIDDEAADLVLLDPGEIGLAGRFHSLTPIMMERYGPSRTESGHFSVAILRKGSSINSINDLHGSQVCFSGVNHMASWIVPLATLIDSQRFEIIDCNNLIKSASNFFGNSCAPNAMINKFNPTGDNPQKMLALCERQSTRVGALPEPYNGALSALTCLVEPLSLASRTFQRNNFFNVAQYRAADVAFLPHNTIFLADKLALTRELRAEIPSKQELELLCPDGTRAPIEKWQSCNFGFVPAHAVVVSSRTTSERRLSIQKFLKTSIELFSSPLSPFLYSTTTNVQQQQSLPGSRFNQMQSGSGSPFEFNLPSPSNIPKLDSQRPISLQNDINNLQLPASISQDKISSNFRLSGDVALINYPSLDLIFSSDMTDLIPLYGSAQTFKGYLNSFPVQLATSSNHIVQSNRNFDHPYANLYQKSVDNSNQDIRVQSDYIEKLRRCPVPALILCVTSDKEFLKCLAMSKAFHAVALKPELNCKQASSKLSCMQLIKNRDADLVVLDPGDIYLANTKFNLVPILSERVDLHERFDYAVAITKKSDQKTDLFSLKTKNSCHSGYFHGAGWVMPMNFLLSNNRIRKYDNSDTARSAAEHFERGCAPGILSSVSNTQYTSSWTVRNMCELCHGSGRAYCARDSSEAFFGDTGALRCLVEGGGDVAFCKHSAIFQNTAGSNRETWARNLIASNFELLCRDGTRAPVEQYKTCNLGLVPTNALVTRASTPSQLKYAFANLFMYGQQHYGSKYSEEYTFKMFSSNNAHDLIFQDSTQQLTRLETANQSLENYLGSDFLRAIQTTFY